MTPFQPFSGNLRPAAETTGAPSNAAPTAGRRPGHLCTRCHRPLLTARGPLCDPCSELELGIAHDYSRGFCDIEEFA